MVPKRYLRKAAVVSIALAFMAAATAADADAKLRGYVTPEYSAWMADFKMPMSDKPVVVFSTDCPFYGGMCYFPKEETDGRAELYLAVDYGFSQEELHAGLFHEYSHHVDFTQMTPAKRKAFRKVIGLNCTWMQTWRKGCGAVAPVEIFAEQYAACAIGVPRSVMEPNVWDNPWRFWWVYEYAPPHWVDETALCKLMASWAR